MSKRKKLNDPFDLILAKFIYSDNEQSYYDYLSELQETKEVLCLTTDPFNLLMWSHYGDGHRGYCIEFQPIFHILNDKEFPIEYIKKRPNITQIFKDFYDSKERLIQGHNEEAIFSYKLSPMFYYKNECWAYEKEHRIISYSKNDKSEGSLHDLMDLGLKITRIICGLNCSKENIKIIKNACEKINRKNYREAKNKLTEYTEKKINEILLKNPEITKDEVIKLILEKTFDWQVVDLTRLISDDNFKLNEIKIDL